MIEVEKKFRATAEQRERLVANATFLFEKENVDIFFDLPDYALSKKWSWLRERNGRMELKVAAHMPENGELCEFFHEYETDEEIREQLALPTSTAPLLDEIISLGYHPFAALHTKRKTYRENSFIIDIDHTTGPDFEYDIVEIELLVEKPEDMERASAEIAAFALAKGLSTDRVNGKLLEFIEKKNSEQFQILVDTGFRKQTP